MQENILNLNSTTQVNLTKEFILSKIREEEIWSFYGVKIQKGLFCSPLRTDKRPTVSLYRSKSGKLLLKDFATGWCGDCFAFVGELFQKTYYSTLVLIANDFGLIEVPKIEKNRKKLEFNGEKIEFSECAKIQVEIRSFQEYELKWWEKYGITEKTLKKFNIFSCKNIWLNGNVFKYESPNQLTFGYYGGVNSDGIELWRIYNPTKKSMKFISNWKGTKLQGAPQLSKDGGEYLCITKSMKDVMVLYEYGIPAIAPCSENEFLTDSQLEKVKKKFKHIVVLYDNDLPGIKAMKKIKKLHPELNYIFIPRKYSKDISDFRKLYGHEKTKELIESTINYYKEKKFKE